MVARDWEQGHGLTKTGHEEIFGDDRNILHLEFGGGDITECISKNLQNCTLKG